LEIKELIVNNGSCPDCGCAMWLRGDYINCISNDCDFQARLTKDTFGECYERN
jgi:hypothetical protein